MIISNTEVSSYNLCKRQHYYQYDLKLEPKSRSLSLWRGSIGHSALEAYYLEMKSGSPVDLCKEAALSVIDVEIATVVAENPDNSEMLQMLVKLKRLIEAYAEVYRQEPFIVIEVEKIYTVPIQTLNNIYYGVILDLLIQYTSGEYRGDFAVVDHKFGYNFKTMAELKMDGQLPKMIKTLRLLDIPITKGVFNQIRYRDLKNPKPEDVFRRSIITPNARSVNQIWEEQLSAAVEILNDPAPARRTLSTLICKNCAFQPLCDADLMGEDTTIMKQTLYKPRSSPFSDWTISSE